MSISVLLADDHLLFRQALKSLLQHQNMKVVAEASDGTEAVDECLRTKPTVAVMDLEMPKMSGLDAAEKIIRSGSPSKVVLLTMHAEPHHVSDALRRGVHGYVLKTQASSDLVDAVKLAANGEVYLSPQISSALVHAFHSREEPQVDPLTPRQREVLRLVAEGMTTREIAATLGVSVKTAESHRHRIMQALNIHDTASLVRYAVRQGIVPP